jgi:hypothetical protein
MPYLDQFETGILEFATDYSGISGSELEIDGIAAISQSHIEDGRSF